MKLGMRRQVLAAAALLSFGALVVGLLATAGGQGKTPITAGRGRAVTPQESAVAAVAGSGTSGFDSADVRYAQVMVADAEQVLAMAKLPQVKSSSGVVPTLAYAALEELPAHIGQYRKWLVTWKKTIPGSPGTGDLGSASHEQFAARFMALFEENQKSVLAAATQEVSAGKFWPARQDAANTAAVTTQTIGSIPPG